MLLIREVFHCRPGKVRPLVEKFQAMNRIMANAGQANMRLMTDYTGERYWTLVAEFETPNLAEFEKNPRRPKHKTSDKHTVTPDAVEIETNSPDNDWLTMHTKQTAYRT